MARSEMSEASRQSRRKTNRKRQGKRVGLVRSGKFLSSQFAKQGSRSRRRKGFETDARP
jgi:hypothetical protein